MFRKLITTLLAVSIVALCASTAFAADLMTDGKFYAKQNGYDTCTLSSAAMMLRRRAYLNGDEDWTSITESAVRPYAWANGLSWNFTYDGMSVSYGTLSSGGNTEELIALLDAHPEGIVAYNRSQYHAVLLTDYTDGVFYCADPAVGASYGRIPFSSSTISLSGVTCYWYVSYDSHTQLEDVTLTNTEIFGLFAPENLSVGSKFSLSGTIQTPENVSLSEVTLKIVDSEGNLVQEATDVMDTFTTEWSFHALDPEIIFNALPIGEYGFSVVAKDTSNATLCYATTFTVSTDSTVTGYHWSLNDAV